MELGSAGASFAIRPISRRATDIVTSIARTPPFRDRVDDRAEPPRVFHPITATTPMSWMALTVDSRELSAMPQASARPPCPRQL
jgi:hypothetical protein